MIGVGVAGAVLFAATLTGTICGLFVIIVVVGSSGAWWPLSLALALAPFVIIGYYLDRYMKKVQTQRHYNTLAWQQACAQADVEAERAAMLASVEEQFPAGWTGEIMEYKRVVRR